MSLTKRQRVLKRLFDITFSSLSIALLMPLFVCVGLFIKLRSPGPCFFKQIRVGLKGHQFFLLKFRSMYTEVFEELNTTTTLEEDPRVFPGGKFIRKYKIDELPQLINVLFGDMSLIGPRPTVQQDYNKMNAEQRRRNSIRPGLSGFAQISGNTSLNWPDRINLDLDYIDNYSFANDLKIVVQTLGMIFSGRADTHPPGNDEWS